MLIHKYLLLLKIADVNECLENNGGCLHRCHNYIGGYYCTCRIGYDMDKDLKKCLGKQNFIFFCPKAVCFYTPFSKTFQEYVVMNLYVYMHSMDGRIYC